MKHIYNPYILRTARDYPDIIVTKRTLPPLKDYRPSFRRECAGFMLVAAWVVVVAFAAVAAGA